MSDIVERLKAWAYPVEPPDEISPKPAMRDAIAEIQRLREALTGIRDVAATGYFESKWREIHEIAKETLDE